MYTLHLLKNFCNYRNRRLMIRATINDYIEDDDIFIGSFEKRNFVWGDGISTSHIINYVGHLPTPSYVIVENESDHSFTRWFVTNCNETRGCQYMLTLKRDSIADKYDEVKSSDLLVKKGFVSNNSVLVFNTEEQNYNSVKTNELLIKDKTASGYVIGFIDSKTAGSNDNDHKVYTNYSDDTYINFDYDDLSETIKNYFAMPNGTPVSTVTAIYGERKENVCLAYNMGVRIDSYVDGLVSNDYYECTDGTLYIKGNGIPGKISQITDTRSNKSNYYCTTTLYTNVETNPTSNCFTLINYDTNTPPSSCLDTIGYNFTYQIGTMLASKSISDYESLLGINSSTKNYLKSYDNQICKINNVYYIAKWTPTNDRHISKNGTNWSNYIFNQMTGYMPSNDIVQTFLTTPNGNKLNYVSGHTPSNLGYTDVVAHAYVGDYYLQLEIYEKKVYTYVTPKANRTHLSDAPYDMFVIPYTDGFTYEVNATSYIANSKMAINLAQQICLTLGDSAVYDIQVVPFCPFQTTAVQDELDFSLENGQAIYDNNNQIVGYYFWAYKSSLNFSIAESRALLTLSSSEYTFKEITQLRQYMLCSPNKDSVFGFNPCMNNGITKWNITIDYRPFSSYCKIQPEWNYLYGSSEYNDKTDNRGLIFNGAYSVTQLTTAWANYVANNKNYQQIFNTQMNTQITKFEMQQKAQWETVGYRNYSFFPISSVLKVIGERKQMDFDRELFNVDIQASRELFNYQLDNIKSQPNPITKLTSINSDFRVFPFIEIYDTTETDLKNFRNLIKFNGMTIMCMGKLEEYLKPNDETFFQASVIRFADFIGKENSNQLVIDINRELETGIYITKEE